MKNKINFLNKSNIISNSDVNDNFANKWRNYFFLWLLIVGVGAGYVYIHQDKSVLGIKDLFETELAQEEQMNEGTVAIGGDISFDELHMMAPQLSPSSTEFDFSSISAHKIIAKDKESGQVLLAQHEYESHAMASITKLMSTLVLLDQPLDWATSTQVIADDIFDTHMYAGDTYTLEELWQAGLVGSSNKAILTMVSSTGYSYAGFVHLMNEKAKTLGMADTLFVEPTGLDSGNISTASDIVLLLTEALKHEKIKNTVLQKELTIFSAERKKEHHMWNTDWLLLGWVTHNFEIVGGKTGFIPASGYNFAVEVTNKDGHAIDVVVLDSADNQKRFTDARAVANWVFENYVWQ